jgi:hypothetical protein
MATDTHGGATGVLFTPPSTPLLLEVRSQAYERQLAQLREQVAQIDDLKAEMVELRERLGQNSSNSSKPPSSDLPRQPQQVQRQPSGRKPGGQPDHPEMDASSKPWPRWIVSLICDLSVVRTATAYCP